MSNKLPVLTELPIISSRIQIDSELLSKKTAELELKRTDESKSSESIKIGDGVPRRTITQTKTAEVTVVTTNMTSNWTYIIWVIIFLISAGSSYYFYINYRKKNKN